MGGVVECGFGVDTKLSPGHAEIERAQAELQHESEIREERRRELEFLEKGGNPLDFKFGHGASASVQSTSCTDQHAEPYVTSEAKGSFTLAASPHGDSVESSEKPGGSMSRETNIGDNLLLFKRENSKVHGERYAKHRGKRGSVGLLEQSSQVGVNHNMKEVDDSIIFRPGANGQAYARRNRSKTTRDSANLSLTDAASRHGNKASVASSNAPASKDIKAQDSSFSSISNAKDENQNCILKVSVADDRADIPLDVEQNNNTTNNMIVDEMPEEVKEVKITENMQLDDSYIQHSSIPENKDTSSQSGAFIVEDGLIPVGLLSTPLESSVSKNTCDVGKINGFGAHDETKIIFDEDDTRNKNFVEGPTSKNLHSDSMDEHTIANGAVNNENPDDEQPLLLRSANGRSGGDVRDQTVSEQSLPDARSLKEDNEAFNSDTHINANNASYSVQLNLSDLVVREKDNDSDGKTEIVSEVTPVANSEPEKLNDEIICESATKMDISSSQPSFTKRKDTGLLLSSAAGFPKVILDNKSSLSTTCFQTSTSDQKKAHEDAILKEAQLIEARLKRAGELPTSSVHLEKHQRCHWDFVLKEMAWMANDFMQERLWKTTAASQVSRLIASCGRTMFKQENLLCKQRSSARSLARAVMDFWRTAELICSDKTPNAREFKSDSIRPSNVNESDVEKGQVPHSVMQYAARFLKHNGEASCHSTLVEAPTTPDYPNGPGILIIPREDKLIEENIFYKVPYGAMQAYRESVEVQLMHHRKLANSVHQEECEASLCNSIAGGHGDDAYEEEEGETGTYLLPGNFEGGLLSKLAHKKRKHMQQKSSATRHNEDGTYFSYEPCSEYKSGNQPFILNGKRNSSTFNVGSFPTKRVRTASRQRFVSPYSSGALGPFQMTSKTDASSEDTSSFLDDQSSLHGGSMARKNSGVDNTVDFDRQLSFDGEISSKSKKKKKKPKHLGYKNSLNIGEPGLLVLPGKGPIRSSYEQRLQTDPSIQHEQNSKRRMESQNFDSNGNTGFGQHVAKKPKLLRQMIEASPDGLVPFAGSLPSPVASQMSNMSNSNKLIKVIASRDRARKSKALKMAAGHSGPGSPWSNFEDQALVVLVHDMGPNWELVSDAMNSTLQFKCIFRKPKECKERHKFLMDKSAGDGADSAEDSGSSQPYPSTLPGIPKGSARQLFQRLQGPIEEDILKTHFEKIILHRQKLSPCSRQIGNQESRQLTQAHSSHVVALSQVCPNNLNGGILTPFDFCESISSSPDVFPLAYQGPHTGSLTVPSHQGPVSPVLPTSNANTILQGSTGLVLSSSLPLASGSSNPSSREPQRFGVPRPSTVSVDDPQRMQQYSQMLPGRNHQQPNVLPGTLPMGVDRGVRMLPVPGGMGLMSGRGIPMSRPTFQGINSPGMLNMVTSGNMVASGSHGIQNSVNVHPSVVSSQGNSTMRPRDPLQMLRPGQNPDEHRQIMMQEMQMQTSPTNGQSVSPFNGISTSFPNATTVPASAQTFPVQQHQQSHQMLQQAHMLGNPHPHIQGTSHSSPQQQAYAMRAAKERQLHQRMMPQLQRHISVPNAVPPAQTNAQVQSQSQSSSTVIPVSSSQGQHKQQNISRNPPSGMSNQINQRQRQQVQQNQSRQPQQQRQSSQQQAKLMKGLGRGGMLINHNLSTDSSQVSGFSAASKNQLSDKNILQQSQGFFPASSALNSTSNQIGNQTNIYPHSLSQSTKQLSPISDTSNQGSTQNSPSNSMLTPQQAAIPSVSLVKHNQQPQHRYLNQSQTGIQRTAIQQNRHINSDDRIQSSTDQCPIVQVVTSASSVQCTDSASSVVSSSTRWNPEPLYDKDAPNPTGYASSKQETALVSDTLVPSSSQGLPHQLSGGMSVHGNTNGGQRQQQQQLQQLQQQQLKHQPQQQHEQLVSRHSDLGAG